AILNSQPGGRGQRHSETQGRAPIDLDQTIRMRARAEELPGRRISIDRQVERRRRALARTSEDGPDEYFNGERLAGRFDNVIKLQKMPLPIPALTGGVRACMGHGSGGLRLFQPDAHSRGELSFVV